MALEAQRLGAQVIAWDRDEDAPATLDGMQTAVVDVTDREAVYAQAATTGDIDVLILNAGVISGRRFLDLPTTRSSARWTSTCSLSSGAPRHSCRAWCAAIAGNHRDDRLAGRSDPVPGLTDYVASKHAAYGFAETLRTELADDAPGCTTVASAADQHAGMFAGATSPWYLPS